MMNPAMYSLQLPKNKARELFTQFDYDYDAVADQLRLVGNKLVLSHSSVDTSGIVDTSRSYTPVDSTALTPISSRIVSPLRVNI